ncbi:MAG: hypothetical protein ACRERV_08765 [Methylococcales bacterium]
MFERLIQKGYQVLALHHAEAILNHDMADAVTEIESVLMDAQLPAEELVRGGGGEGELTQRLRRGLAERQRKLITQAAKSQGSFEAGWAHAFVADKFGEATTHWRKLDDRVRRGVGNPCPLLLVGIPREIVIE